MSYIKPIAAILAVGLISTTAIAGYAPKHARKHSACQRPSQHAVAVGNSYQAGANASTCWFNRLTVSGTADLVYSHLSSDFAYEVGTPNDSTGVAAVTLNTDDDSAQFFRLNNVNVFLDAAINPSVNAHFNIHYGNHDIFAKRVSAPTGSGIINSIDKTPSTANTFTLDEAYVTYHDAARSPVYVKIGKGFNAFGNYQNPYTSTPSFAQAFAQASITGIELGMSSDANWHASAWTYEANDTDSDGFKKFGARIGYQGQYNQVGVNFNASMVNDARTLGSTSAVKNYFMADTTSTTNYSKETAYNAHLGLNYQDMTAFAAYTATSGSLRDTAAFTTASTTVSPTTIKGEPKIYSFGLGYHYKTAGHNQAVKVGYETANKNGANVFYGKTHWNADYTVDLSKNFQAYVAYNHYKMHAVSGAFAVEGTDAAAGSFYATADKPAKLSVFTVGFKAHM